MPEPDGEEDDADDVPAPAGQQEAIEASPSRRRTFAGLAILAGMLALSSAGALAWWVWPSAALKPESTLAVQNGVPAKPLPPLSLVVLPFTNLSSDPEQEFFADGLTADLTTDLSHLAGSFVIARNTAFTYKGKAVDVRQLGRDLGVRYALEGSVRRTGDEVVLNAQLISTESGAHLWADRFEGERSKLGRLQVEFVARLARSLDVQLTQAEGLRVARQRPENPTTADLNMLGWAALNRERTRKNTLEARSYFEQSLIIQPKNAETMIGLARAIAQAISTKVSSEIDADKARALDLINEGLAALPQSAMGHYTMAEVLRSNKDFERGLRETKIAIEFNPNMAIAYDSAGMNNLYAGRAGEVFSYVEKAIALSPKDPLLSVWEYHICHAHTHLGHWERAIEWCNRSVEHSPYFAAYVDLAAANAWIGRKEEAADAVGRLLKLMPGYTVQKWARADWSRNPTFLKEYELIVEGLRMAGLPEGATD